MLWPLILESIALLLLSCINFFSLKSPSLIIIKAVTSHKSVYGRLPMGCVHNSIELSEAFLLLGLR